MTEQKQNEQPKEQPVQEKPRFVLEVQSGRHVATVALKPERSEEPTDG